jgi:hypothetical protein
VSTPLPHPRPHAAIPLRRLCSMSEPPIHPLAFIHPRFRGSSHGRCPVGVCCLSFSFFWGVPLTPNVDTARLIRLDYPQIHRCRRGVISGKNPRLPRPSRLPALRGPVQFTAVLESMQFYFWLGSSVTRSYPQTGRDTLFVCCCGRASGSCRGCGFIRQSGTVNLGGDVGGCGLSGSQVAGPGAPETWYHGCEAK